ncbi:general stress protein [Rathayibacter sp. YIM 133350]|uniref:general stress protein n=1 Tax=Rathayibacter sp. YIM 133350 TaxID=3131992 RepID=UPI00307EF9DD
MSTQNPFQADGRQGYPTLPRGEVVASYETYAEAQQAVDRLAHADFPVKQLSIIGSDLKTVERVTGKMSYGRAALAGAASGAWLGTFFGLLMFIFLPTGGSIGFVLAAVLIGAGFGMLFGIVTYSVNRRRKDFTSTMQVLATSYSVIVDPEFGNRARNILNAPSTDGARVVEADASPVRPGDPAPAPVRHPDET